MRKFRSQKNDKKSSGGQDFPVWIEEGRRERDRNWAKNAKIK